MYARLLNPGFDPRNTVLLSEDPGLKGLGKCKVTLLSYKQNGEKVKTECKEGSILVFSEPYNSDWRVKINGVESKLYQANGRFMAVVVPPGEATVELNYFPKSLKQGAAISLISLAVFIYLATKIKKPNLAK
jgi:uncharacterized membrane protein YfhO